jgi:hypothetical protein
VFDDTLSDRGRRRHGLELLERGSGLVSRCLPIDVPVPISRRWRVDTLTNERFEDPDEYFGALVCALFDDPDCGPSGWTRWLSRYATLLSGRSLAKLAYQAIAPLAAIPDEELIRRADNQFDVHAVNLLDGVGQRRFNYCKVNHGFWEYLTLLSQETPQEGPAGGVVRSPLYDESEFTELMLLCIETIARRLTADGAVSASLAAAQYAFGISFGNGEVPVHEEMVAPLHPRIRAAMRGALGAIPAVVPSQRIEVADGSAPKQLFWNDRLDVLCSAIVDASDAVVFIVPPHLRRLAIRGWEGPLFRIVIPGTHVEHLWPAVVPFVIGAVDETAERYRRTTVITQSSLMSAVISVALELATARRDGRSLRYVDMGQVLDVAGYPEPAGPWAGRSDVREEQARRSPPALYLQT